MEQTATVANGIDILAVFDNIQINNEEKISLPDKEFCERQQCLLDASLDQIDKWYNFFLQEVLQYKESHRITFVQNGTVKTNPPYSPSENYPSNYHEFEFRPFDTLNKLVERRFRAINRFGRTIISYFNNTYSLSIPQNEPDGEQMSVTLRPSYLSYVDLVIDHMGGRDFRETAEDEIISRFRDKVLSRYKKMPELKNNKIIFYDVIRFDEFYYKSYQQYHLSYSYTSELNTFCEGIALVGNDSLNGSTRIIPGFNTNYVNITEPYSIQAGEAEKMKFYKNGRIDVCFSSKATAEAAYKRLLLNKVSFQDN